MRHVGAFAAVQTGFKLIWCIEADLANCLC
jgi:hypothetical protein